MAREKTYSASYYPRTRQLREGNETDIKDSGERLFSFQPSTYIKSASDPRIAQGHPYTTDVHLTGASPNMINFRATQVEIERLKEEGQYGDMSAAKWNRMNMLTRSAALNDSAIHQITIVQFVQQLIGRINSLNVINKAFMRIPSDNLRGKIPEGGAPGVTVQVSRLQEPTITHTDFGQTEYRIKRNDMHLYISREDRMEATLDPLSFSAMQGNQLLMQVRDLMALQALSFSPENTETTFPTGTNSIASSGNMSVFPRAQADSSQIFQEIVNNHWLKYRNVLRYIIMNPLDYRYHETNYYSRNKTAANPVSGWGIRPFLGLETWGTTAILTPWAPRNRAYFVGDQGAYELDGPKVVDSEYDAEKFADYFPVRDFVGYLLVNPKRFTTKATLNIEGLTTGPEITTNDQIQRLVELPDDLVDKNDDA